MSQFVFYIALTFSVCLAISTSKPLKSLREYISKKNLMAGQFVACQECLSLWISPFIFYYIYGVIRIEMIPFALISFGFVHFLSRISNKLR